MYFGPKIRIWLDDQFDDPTIPQRHPRPGFIGSASIIHVARLIKIGAVEYISFDHDLGNRSPFTGYTLARLIEKWAHTHKLPNWINYNIHSANPVGAKNIFEAMESARKAYGK